MPKFRLILLLSVAVLSSGYRWRCYAACDEQTGIQNDYVEQRDQCREEAQNNLDAAMAKTANPNSEKARKAKLVVLFSDCMGKFGWDVPVPAEKGEKEKILAGEVPIYVSSAVRNAAPKDGLSPAPAPDNTAVIKEDREADKAENKDASKNVDNTANTQKNTTKAVIPDKSKQQNRENTENQNSSKSTRNTTTNNNIAQKPQNQPAPQREPDQPENMRSQPATTRQMQKQDNITNTNAVQRTYNNEEKPQPEETSQQTQQEGRYQPIQKPRPTPKRKPLPEAGKPAPVTTITPDTADQALNESIQKPPAPVTENKIKYRNKAPEIANDNPQHAQPKIIPQQPATTVRAKSATPVQAQKPDAIQPAQPTANNITAKAPDNANPALTESIQSAPVTENKIVSNKASSPVNETVQQAPPKIIPQQPGTTARAKPIAPLQAQPDANADQALAEAMKKRPSSVATAKASSNPVNDNSSMAKSANTSASQAPTYSPRQAQTPAQPPATNNIVRENNTVKETTIYRNNPAPAPKTAPAPVNAGQPAGGSHSPITAPAVAPVAGEPKIPSQPAVTKAKPANPRAAECELARRNATTSPAAAQQAKQCDIECDKILKAAPKIINPAPCPVKDAAVNILDLQLGNKK